MTTIVYVKRALNFCGKKTVTEWKFKEILKLLLQLNKIYVIIIKTIYYAYYYMR